MNIEFENRHAAYTLLQLVNDKLFVLSHEIPRLSNERFLNEKNAEIYLRDIKKDYDALQPIKKQLDKIVYGD